ncbi:DNA primase [Labrenzia sp. EL_208]|nr:DNA primase [Labrenzia sp. EL_132]MBG6228159.1 DNA primase [Labrenzia sp. EL_208]
MHDCMAAIKLLRKFDRVLIWADDDKPGHQAILQRVDKLRPEGVRLAIPRRQLLLANDPNELLKNHGPDAVMAVVKNPFSI